MRVANLYFTKHIRKCEKFSIKLYAKNLGRTIKIRMILRKIQNSIKYCFDEFFLNSIPNVLEH